MRVPSLVSTSLGLVLLNGKDSNRSPMATHVQAARSVADLAFTQPCSSFARKTKVNGGDGTGRCSININSINNNGINSDADTIISPLQRSRRWRGTSRKGTSPPLAATTTAIRLEDRDGISGDGPYEGGNGGGGCGGGGGGGSSGRSSATRSVSSHKSARRRSSRATSTASDASAGAGAGAADADAVAPAPASLGATTTTRGRARSGSGTARAAMSAAAASTTSKSAIAAGPATASTTAAAAAAVGAVDNGKGRKASRGAGDNKKRRRLLAASARREKERRTGGRAFVIVCDAQSVTHPELVDCINIVEEVGTWDVGIMYADWKVTPSWLSCMYQRSKAERFKTVQRDPLPPGSNPLGDDTMTVDVMSMARSPIYKKYEFCLVSSNDSMAELAKRLKGEGRVVRGVGRRQAPEVFLKNCDAFMYIDPANRYELLMDEVLVISVALCVALAAAGQERCDWVRIKTIVGSLHAWDLGLEPPNWFGYSDYGEMVEVMGTYVQGVEDTSGEAVVKVPPKPAKEVPRGLEEVATYLYAKWSGFTKDPRMNDILIACIPACLQAVAVSRAEMKVAVKRFQQRGSVECEAAE